MEGMEKTERTVKRISYCRDGYRDRPNTHGRKNGQWSSTNIYTATITPK